jgi:hypothetical protein
MPWNSDNVPSIMVVRILRALGVEETRGGIYMMQSDDSIRYPLRGGLFIPMTSLLEQIPQIHACLLHLLQ